MSSQRCSNCSAPIPLTEGAEIVRCPFCKTDNRIAAAFAPAPVSVQFGSPRGAPAAGATRPSRAPVVIVALSIVIAVALAGVGAALLTLSPSPAVAPAPGPFPESVAVAEPTLRVSDLGTWQGTSMHTRLDSSGIVGTFVHFDPVANVPWAIDAARHWSPDAVLYAIYVRRVTADGSVDLSASESGSADVDYRFFSPTRRAAARQLAAVSTTAAPVTELYVMVGESAVKIRADTETDPDEPTAEPAPNCPLASVIATMRAAGLAPRPGYDLMTHASGGVWTWVVNMTDLPVSVPRTPASCAPP